MPPRTSLRNEQRAKQQCFNPDDSLLHLQEIQMKTIAIILATAALSLSVLSVAQASGSDEIASVTVRFADLDLTRSDGLSSLYTRLSQAANSVCRDDSEKGVLVQQRYRVCMDQAIKGAVAKIDQPAFSDYVARKTGSPASSTGVKLAAK
jgi:UrcA family protein